MDVEPERALEQLVRDQEAVGADDDRVRRDADRRTEPRRLLERDAEPLGHLLCRRRPHLAATPARLVRAREQLHDVVLRREPLEHVGPELPGRGDRDPPGHAQPMTMRGRRLASASRLASEVVRSRIRTPSRWSASCWATREYGSASSYRTSAPCSSCPWIVIDAGRSTGRSTP